VRSKLTLVTLTLYCSKMSGVNKKIWKIQIPVGCRIILTIDLHINPHFDFIFYQADPGLVTWADSAQTENNPSPIRVKKSSQGPDAATRAPASYPPVLLTTWNVFTLDINRNEKGNCFQGIFPFLLWDFSSVMTKRFLPHLLGTNFIRYS
jgi:hypothetical protein